MNIVQSRSNLAQAASGRPLFTAEGPQLYGQAYAHNAPFALAKAAATRPGAVGAYQTPLPPPQEQQFRRWVAQNRIPFDPNAAKVDYDMRGFWLAQQAGGQGRAGNGHFPDTFKTPYDTTYSAESRYATANNPFDWIGQLLIDGRNGQVVSR